MAAGSWPWPWPWPWPGRLDELLDRLDPIWTAMGDADLPILHHSFFYEPPYFPGYRDIWDNIVIARAAAHPWGAERLVGYLTLSGLFDRFPRLRVGFAECSAGWLPGWLVRLGGQAAYMSHAVPSLSKTPLEYAHDDRIFCGIELYEGEAMAEAIVRGLWRRRADVPIRLPPSRKRVPQLARRRDRAGRGSATRPSDESSAATPIDTCACCERERRTRQRSPRRIHARPKPVRRCCATAARRWMPQSWPRRAVRRRAAVVRAGRGRLLDPCRQRWCADGRRRLGRDPPRAHRRCARRGGVRCRSRVAGR